VPDTVCCAPGAIAGTDAGTDADADEDSDSGAAAAVATIAAGGAPSMPALVPAWPHMEGGTGPEGEGRILGMAWDTRGACCCDGAFVARRC